MQQELLTAIWQWAEAQPSKLLLARGWASQIESGRITRELCRDIIAAMLSTVEAYGWQWRMVQNDDCSQTFEIYGADDVLEATATHWLGICAIVDAWMQMRETTHNTTN